jgi:hypothetical protein
MSRLYTAEVSWCCRGGVSPKLYPPVHPQPPILPCSAVFCRSLSPVTCTSQPPAPTAAVNRTARCRRVVDPWLPSHEHAPTPAKPSSTPAPTAKPTEPAESSAHTGPTKATTAATAATRAEAPTEVWAVLAWRGQLVAPLPVAHAKAAKRVTARRGEARAERAAGPNRVPTSTRGVDAATRALLLPAATPAVEQGVVEVYQHSAAAVEIRAVESRAGTPTKWVQVAMAYRCSRDPGGRGSGVQGVGERRGARGPPAGLGLMRAIRAGRPWWPGRRRPGQSDSAGVRDKGRVTHGAR